MRFTMRSVPKAAAIALAACSSLASSLASAAVLDITTLSNRPNLISGGDALVQVTTDSGGLAGATITVNGADVTAQFHVGTAPNTLAAVVTGLNIGANTVVSGARR